MRKLGVQAICPKRNLSRKQHEASILPRFRTERFVRGIFVTVWVGLAFLAGIAPAASMLSTLAASPTVPGAAQILENMVVAQRGLLDFTANVTLRIDLPLAKLVPLSFKLYSKRPNKVKAVWSGVSLLPRRGLFFPDPAQFTAGGYSLVVAGLEKDHGRARYILDVTPEAALGEPLRWRFWIDGATWLIVRARMTDPLGEQSTLEADYMQLGEACWVPARMRGKGAMLLLDFFPYLGLGWLEQNTRFMENLEFTAIFRDHRVNAGLEDAFFSH